MKRNPPPNNVRRVRSTGLNNVSNQIGIDGEIVQTESKDLEKLHFYHLLRNQSITKITSQPVKIHFVDEKYKKRTYIPDFLITLFEDKAELHECSLQKRRNNSNIKRRERAGKEFSKKKGWKYKVITPDDYPCITTNTNLRNLSPFRFDEFKNNEIKYFAQNLLSSTRKQPFKEVAQITSSELQIMEGDVNISLFHFIWKDFFKINWSTPIFMLGEINRRLLISNREEKW